MSTVRTPSVIPSRSCEPPRASRGIGMDELSSSQLLRGEREVVIRHGDQLYRLRHTRNDKLILTK